jgi:hypothetical protein
VWLAVAAFAMVVLVGLAADLGGQVHAKLQAQHLAVEAARAGSQQLMPGRAMRGQGAVVEPGRAVAAAQAYLAGASDVTGTVSVLEHGTVAVDTASTYRTRFLGVIGIGSLTVTGHAEARVVRAVEGVAR